VINYPVTDENLDDVKPFADVNDAAHYVNTLRQQTWINDRYFCFGKEE